MTREIKHATSRRVYDIFESLDYFSKTSPRSKQRTSDTRSKIITERLYTALIKIEGGKK